MSEYGPRIDRAKDAIAALNDEIDTLRLRSVFTEEDAAHVRALRKLCFVQWYDPDNEYCEAFARQVEPHVKALCDRFNISQ